MKKVHKLVASILAMVMLLTSANFAVFAAEVADATTEATAEAPAEVTTFSFGEGGGELPLEGVIDGIDIDWENYVAESTGTKFTRDYTLGLTGEYDDVPSTGTEDRFWHVRNSLPDEVPCFAPYTRAEIDASATKFYVAPDGDDKNEGTIDAPFATPYRAIKAVNALNSKRGGVTVYFRGGMYSLDRTLELNQRTSGLDEKNLVFLSNYKDEKVTFVGAAAVSGKDFKPASDAKFKSKVAPLAQPYVVSVNLKDLGFKDMGTWTNTSRPSLYVDGAAYTIARWPNGANTSMAQYTGKDAQFGVKNKGVQNTASELGAAGSGTGNFAFKYSNPRPHEWEFTDNIWMYGYWYAEWTKEHLRVEKFDKNEFVAYTNKGLSYGGKYVKGNTYYYYNIFEELDQPGEWYLDDKTGMLYIYPIGELKEDSVVQLVTTSFDLIETKGTKYAVINQIDFDMGNRAVVYSDGSMYNIVQRCHIKNMATYALTAASSRFCGFIVNLVEPNNSIQINGAAGNSNSFWKEQKRAGNFAQNNYCKRIQTGSGKGNVMSHNLLNGSQGMGLYVNGSGESIIEYNEVVAGPDEQLDAGSVYVNGGATNYGNTIRYNYLNKSTPVMRSSPYCLYLDDISSGQFVYGNILREGRTYLHSGSYNTLYNNFTFGNGDNFKSMHNSNNYSLTADRWSGWVLTGTRYTSGQPGHYGLTWMDRFPYIYYWHSTLIGHRYNFYSDGYVPSEATDPVGWELTSPKQNVYSNNVFVSATISLEQSTREDDEVAENNYNFKAEDVPKFQFTDYERGIVDVPEDVWAELCPGVEPMKKNVQFGIVYDPATIPVPMKLGAITPQSPADDAETPILATGVVLKWNEVYGKSSYNVKLAKDPEFKDVVLDQEQQGETVALPELEYDQQYWWTVTTNMWTNKFDQTPVQMPVATFKTMTLEEAENYAELDTATLQANLADIAKALGQSVIVEEGSPEAENYPKDMPLYKAGTKEKMQKIYDEAKAKFDKGFKKQAEVEAINATLMKDFYLALEENALPYEVIIGEGSHQFIKDETIWKENSDKLGPHYNGSSMVMDGNQGSGMLTGTKIAVSSGATFKANVLYEKLSQWTGITFKSSGGPVSGSFTNMTGYGIVVKPDIIELQRYPKVGNNSAILVVVENNEQICRSGVAFDVEATIKTQKDGVHVVVKIDGETIIDHLDKEAPVEVWGPGSYGFMHNSGNTSTTISKYTGVTGGANEEYMSLVPLEKAITEASKFEATVVEGEAGSEPTYKVGSKAKLTEAINTATAAKETVTNKAEVTAAVDALNAVVEDVKRNDANECTYVLRELDLSQWKNTSPLSVASIEENGGIIAIVPDENESTNYEFKTLMTSKQMMKFGLKYDNTGNWAAINTRKVSSGVSPTQTRGYFFVIKDDLIEFQKYTGKSKGEIVVTIENNNQIVKPAITHEIEVGSVNVEGGVLSKLIVDGETIIEYLDTEDPIYDQGYFSLFCHSKLGRVALSPIADK